MTILDNHLRRFSVNDAFKAGAYLKVNKNVGSQIDWVSILSASTFIDDRLISPDSTTFRYASLKNSPAN